MKKYKLKCGKLLAFIGKNRTSSRLAKKDYPKWSKGMGKLTLWNCPQSQCGIIGITVALLVLVSLSKYGYF